MEDDEWNDIDFRAKATIVLCLSDEILYNVMNRETKSGLWCRLHDKEFVEQALHEELYSLRMKEGMSILQHLNVFNRILSDLLALEVKLEKRQSSYVTLFSFINL